MDPRGKNPTQKSQSTAEEMENYLRKWKTIPVHRFKDRTPWSDLKSPIKLVQLWSHRNRLVDSQVKAKIKATEERRHPNTEDKSVEVAQLLDMSSLQSTVSGEARPCSREGGWTQGYGEVTCKMTPSQKQRHPPIFLFSVNLAFDM